MIEYLTSFNFGLTQIAGQALYATFIVAVFWSIFKSPIAGLYYLAPLIPAQTIRSRMDAFPLGASVVTIVLLAVAIGLMRSGEPLFPKSPWKTPVLITIGFTFISFLYGTVVLHESFPPDWSSRRFEDWRNYATMLFMALLVSSAVKTTKQIKIMVGIIAFGILVFNRGFWADVSGRDFSSYSNDLRNSDGGVLGYAGINGLAAFEAQSALFLLGLSGFLKFKWKVAALALTLFSAICLMYSLARAGYVALAFGAIVLAVIHYRWLLVVMVAFGMTWTTLVPNAVVERVTMTQTGGGSAQFDSSAESRISLWEEAMDTITANPVFGTGFNTYAYMQHFRNYQDSHNIYIKVVAETGYLGLGILLTLMFTTFGAGYRLYKQAQLGFHKGLGLGLVGWVTAAMAANFFGDRWTFLQVNGYMWLFSGLVAAAMTIEANAEENEVVLDDEFDEESMELDAA